MIWTTFIQRLERFSMLFLTQAPSGPFSWNFVSFRSSIIYVCILKILQFFNSRRVLFLSFWIFLLHHSFHFSSLRPNSLVLPQFFLCTVSIEYFPEGMLHGRSFISCGKQHQPLYSLLHWKKSKKNTNYSYG